MQIIVDSLLINYQTYGSAKRTILILHGWGDDLSSFKALAQQLSGLYTIVLVDLPGFGGSEAPLQSWGLREYADFLQHFIKKLKIEVDVLVGHSNGGSIAIFSLANKILQAEKLILLASAGIRNQQKGRKQFIKLLTKSGKLATFWLPSGYKNKLKQRLYKQIGSDMLIKPSLQESFKKIVNQDIQSDAKKITVPTLIIYGEQDKITPPLYGEIFHQLIDGSTLKIIGEAGHFVHHDQLQLVAPIIKDFLT